MPSDKTKTIQPAGKDWHEYRFERAEEVLLNNGFYYLGEDRDQHFTHSTVFHYLNPNTKQRATISLKGSGAKEVATVSYHSTYKRTRRTREEIDRANFVLYD